MKASLPYGKHKLTITVPDNTSVITGTPTAAVIDTVESLKRALSNPSAGPPLADILSPGDQVVITHTDITRATPNHIIIPVLTSYLEEHGIPAKNITLLNSTGTHRAQTQRELEEMLGKETAGKYRIIQHDALNEKELFFAGSLETGNDIYINRAYIDADVRIVTGFIEPHFFAGFSGGPKAVLPGISGMQSIMKNHSTAHIENPAATWAVTRGNPLWEEIAAAAELAPPDFMLNVTLDDFGDITGIFTGELFEAHRKGCNFTADHAMVNLEHPYDIVITSNSGYPLDQNLYQTIKGISAAASITRPGGAIIIAAACSDGIPSHGDFGELLRRFTEPEVFLNFLHKQKEPRPDQWQMQILAHLALRYRIFIYSAGLREEKLITSFFTLIENIEDTLKELAAGPGMDIAILPEGPQTIAVTTPKI